MGFTRDSVCPCEPFFQMNRMQVSVRQFVICASLLVGIVGDSSGADAPPQFSGVTANTSEISTNDVLSLQQVLRDVLVNNPSLKSARANWEAMKQRVPQARAWEDLKSEFDTVVGRFVSIPPNSFTDQRLMVEQAVPLAGRNRLRGEAAEAEAVAAFAELHRRELDLTAKARTAFYRLANAGEQLRIVDANLELLKQFARISRKKYESGTGTQSDVLAAETDASKLEESRYDLVRQISDTESQLNVLMNRPAQSPLPHPGEIQFVTVHYDLQHLQALAMDHRPELVMGRMKTEAAHARLTASKREWIPDPSLRVEASRYNDSGPVASEVMAGVAINIPWLNRSKYRAAIEEARQMEIGAEYDLESAEKETLGLVREAYNKVETLHHHVELFRDRILVLARQNASATRQAYETDKAPFLNLIDAQRTLQEVEGMYRNHLSEYLSSLAELESVVGTDPTRTPEMHQQSVK
jgi:outer membrane protein, heavy metal efflux system